MELEIGSIYIGYEGLWKNGVYKIMNIYEEGGDCYATIKIIIPNKDDILNYRRFGNRLEVDSMYLLNNCNLLDTELAKNLYD